MSASFVSLAGEDNDFGYTTQWSAASAGYWIVVQLDL